MENAQMLEYAQDFQSDRKRWARGSMVSGEILLLMNLLPMSLLYQGALDGSKFWTLWVLIQGGIGLVMFGGGWIAQRVS